MLNMKTIKPLLIFLIFVTISCEKEFDDENGKSISNEIHFGDYTKMIVKHYDTILNSEYPGKESIDLDIDNDNNNDIRLISETWGSPGYGYNPRSIIWCLHENVLLNGYQTNDTNFLNRDTRILSGPNNITEIWINLIYSCKRIDKNDSILSICHNVFKLSPHNRNELLINSDVFNCDSITLIDDWYSFTSAPKDSGIDTVMYERVVHSNDCFLFPLEEIKYIGLLLGNDTVSRLAWIKLSIINNNIISILESAIQE